MLIRTSNDAKPPRASLGLWRVPLIVVVVLVSVVCAGLLASFYAGGWAYRMGVHKVVRANIDLIRSPDFLESLWAPSRLPVFHIDMKFKHWTTVRGIRDTAMRTGVLSPAQSTWVPAAIRLGDDRYRVKMRLKGRRSDHWDSDRWSFRVRTKDQKAIAGIRRFAIQHPKTRGYLREWAWLEHLRLEGVLAVRYRFVDVVFNGDRKGVYAMEERFERELLESQHRRVGVVLTFDNTVFWADWGNPVLQSIDYANTGIATRTEKKGRAQ